MERVRPFDPAKYLTSADARQELLEDALASGNAAYVADAEEIVARARRMPGVKEGTHSARIG